MAHWGDLPKSLAQLQFEEGVPVAGEDTVVTGKVMTANMISAQAIWVSNRARETHIDRHNASMKEKTVHMHGTTKLLTLFTMHSRPPDLQFSNYTDQYMHRSCVVTFLHHTSIPFITQTFI